MRYNIALQQLAHCIYRTIFLNRMCSSCDSQQHVIPTWAKCISDLPNDYMTLPYFGQGLITMINTSFIVWSSYVRHSLRYTIAEGRGKIVMGFKGKIHAGNHMYKWKTPVRRSFTHKMSISSMFFSSKLFHCLDYNRYCTTKINFTSKQNILYTKLTDHS